MALFRLFTNVLRRTARPVHVRTDLRSAQLHPIGAEVERAFGARGAARRSEDPAPAGGGGGGGKMPAAVCARLHWGTRGA